MTGNINDVIHAPHNIEVIITVFVSTVTCQVITGKIIEIFFPESFIILPQCGQTGKQPGGIGNFTTTNPSLFSSSCCPSSEKICISNPQTGIPAEPALVCNCS